MSVCLTMWPFSLSDYLTAHHIENGWQRTEIQHSNSRFGWGGDRGSYTSIYIFVYFKRLRVIRYNEKDLYKSWTGEKNDAMSVQVRGITLKLISSMRRNYVMTRNKWDNEAASILSRPTTTTTSIAVSQTP